MNQKRAGPDSGNSFGPRTYKRTAKAATATLTQASLARRIRSEDMDAPLRAAHYWHTYRFTTALVLRPWFRMAHELGVVMPRSSR